MEEEEQKQDLTDSKLCNEQQRSVLRKSGKGGEGGRVGGRKTEGERREGGMKERGRVCMCGWVGGSEDDLSLLLWSLAEQGLEKEKKIHQYSLEK